MDLGAQLGLLHVHSGPREPAALPQSHPSVIPWAYTVLYDLHEGLFLGDLWPLTI